jgi:hypothetical protein
LQAGRKADFYSRHRAQRYDHSGYRAFHAPGPGISERTQGPLARNSCGRRFDRKLQSRPRPLPVEPGGCYATGSRVVDKYPELVFRIPFVREIFPDAKFIFLARNGWNTCCSIGNWSGRLGQEVGGEIHDWWGADRRKWNLLVEQLVPEYPDLEKHAAAMRNWTKQTDMAALEWIITMREGLKLEQLYPAQVTRVNYEDLCSNPRDLLTACASFLEITSDDEPFLKYAEQTLKPDSGINPFHLDKRIENTFLDTMSQLGYGS